jgi:hypothetical protein
MLTDLFELNVIYKQWLTGRRTSGIIYSSNVRVFGHVL